MVSRLFLLAGWILMGCFLCGCARPGMNARAVVQPENDTTSLLVAAESAGDAVDRAEPPKDARFQFPDDGGGALLAKILPPDVPHTAVERSTTPRRQLAPHSLESPSLPLTPAPLTIPRLPPGKNNHPLQPRLVLTETLSGSPLEPRLPQALSLPAGELTRVPSVDVNKPIPLPILGQPLSDRAPVEDATGEASNAAAIAGIMPQRTQPTPFVRINLPDPFEFRKPVGMPKTPAEEPNPPTGTPKPPKP